MGSYEFLFGLDWKKLSFENLDEVKTSKGSKMDVSYRFLYFRAFIFWTYPKSFLIKLSYYFINYL